MGNPVAPFGFRHPVCPNFRVLLDVVIDADQSVLQFHSKVSILAIISIFSGSPLALPVEESGVRT
jgi:hypothetical protein